MLATRVCTSPIQSARNPRLHFAYLKCLHFSIRSAAEPAAALRLSEVPAERACTSPNRRARTPRLHFAYPKCAQHAPALFYPKCRRTSGRTSPIRSARRTRLHFPIQSARRTRLHFAHPTCAHPASASRLLSSKRLHFAYPNLPQASVCVSPLEQHASPLRLSKVPATRIYTSPRGQARVCTSLIRSAWQPAPALLLARDPRAALRPSEVPAIRACTSPLELHASAVRVSEVPATRACTSPRPQTHVCTSPIRSASDRRLRCLSISTRLHFAPPKCLQPARALRLGGKPASAFRLSNSTHLHFACPKCQRPACALRRSEVPGNPRVHFASPATRGLHFGPSEVPAPARALRLGGKPASALRLSSSTLLHFASEGPTTRVCTSPLELHASALGLSEVPGTAPVLRLACNGRLHFAYPKWLQPRVHFASPTSPRLHLPIPSACNRVHFASAASPRVHFASPASPQLHFAYPKCLQRASALRLSAASAPPSACNARLYFAYPKWLQPRVHLAYPKCLQPRLHFASPVNPRLLSAYSECRETRAALRESAAPATRGSRQPEVPEPGGLHVTFPMGCRGARGRRRARRNVTSLRGCTDQQ